ncbi:MAG: hypothetical protein R3F30_04110 [Planctomycetota bacterium]
MTEPLDDILPDDLRAFVAAWLEGREGPAVPGVLDLSPTRMVLRVEGEGGTEVLKLDRRRGLRERLKRLVRGSPLAAEGRRLAEARARGLPCAAPLGHARRPGLEVLRLADLGPGRDLGSWLRDPSRDRGAAREALGAAGALLARAFAGGLVHGDLHLGNLHRAEDGGLALLDLHAARFARGPHRPGPRELRPLYLSLPWPEDEALRRALFAPIGLDPSPRALERWRRTWLSRRLVRCLRDSGSFRRRGRLIQRRELALERADLEDLAATGEPLKAGRRGAVLRTADGILKLRRTDRALAHWLAAEGLALRRVPSPRALAFLGGRRGTALVLSQELRGARPLDALAPGEALAAAADLGRSLGRLHGTGWRFRDARGDNFLVARGRVHLVDLEGVRALRPWARGRAEAADLGRLHAWLTAQAPPALAAAAPVLGRGFLRAYLRERRALGRPERALRSFVRRIGLRSARWKRAHQGRHDGGAGSGAT